MYWSSTICPFWYIIWEPPATASGCLILVEVEPALTSIKSTLYELTWLREGRQTAVRQGRWTYQWLPVANLLWWYHQCAHIYNLHLPSSPQEYPTFWSSGRIWALWNIITSVTKYWAFDSAHIDYVWCSWGTNHITTV